MSVALLDGGRLEIQSARGVARLYELAPAPRPYAAWGCTLARADGKAAYHVWLGRDGHWRCDCDAARYGKGPCKHRRAVSALYSFLERVGLLIP